MSVLECETWDKDDDFKDGYRISALDLEGNQAHSVWVPFNPYRDMPAEYDHREIWALAAMAEYWMKRTELAETYTGLSTKDESP